MNTWTYKVSSQLKTYTELESANNNNFKNAKNNRNRNNSMNQIGLNGG